MQTNVTSLQDATVAVDDIRSAPERYSSAASSSQAQSDNQAVNMQSGKHRAVPNTVHLTEHFRLGEGATRQVSPLTAAGTQNAKSHSLTVSGSAMVSSPTMNFNSPGATGASTKKSFFFQFCLMFVLSANTYFGTQPAHSPPPEASAQNRHLEGPGFKCMEFTDNSVVYSPTFNDESPDASGACAYFPMHYVKKPVKLFSPQRQPRDSCCRIIETIPSPVLIDVICIRIYYISVATRYP